MLAFLSILVTIILLLILLSMIWPPDSPWSPWWRTDKGRAELMCELANVKETDIVYDLGSGDGEALIVAARECGAEGVGVEIDPIRVWVSKMRIKRRKAENDIKILRKNFFDVDLSSATVVFAYLIPRALERLKPKFLEELKPGTRVVTFVYKMDLPLIASDEKNEIYVYKIPEIKQ